MNDTSSTERVVVSMAGLHLRGAKLHFDIGLPPTPPCNPPPKGGGVASICITRGRYWVRAKVMPPRNMFSVCPEKWERGGNQIKI